MPSRPRVAIVCGVAPGTGGLAVQAANAVAALGRTGAEVHVIAPGARQWPRPDSPPESQWHALAEAAPRWSRWAGLRRARGRAQWVRDRALGRAAAAHLARIRPDACYAFTQVAREPLEWARVNGVPSMLESPNGHIVNFRNVYISEHQRWCDGTYLGHPTPAMVARVEEEYGAAGRIRVSSEWSRRSLVEGGVPDRVTTVLQQPVDLVSFAPAGTWPALSGPLRVVFVGTLDLRKGFVYLLEAARALGPGAISVELVGGTVDRCTRRLLESLRSGLEVRCAPGDPRPAFQRAELAVLPTLEDGSPFAAAEAMASGLPIVVTDCCGAAEWVEPGSTGWVVPGRDAEALAAALDEARRRRASLRDMGRAARAATERRADPPACDRRVAEWVLEAIGRPDRRA